jgi:hypothetical protein
MVPNQPGRTPWKALNHRDLRIRPEIALQDIFAEYNPRTVAGFAVISD